ncbi:hypothetical protein BRARA_A03290 [Brassica rapa]|uniref:Protein kinase domain-containing protein n=1 Tax=Brassica campestris TaxID=3711 RepID=A0A398AYP4_BRACM|nr:hypothetical protein BRARA_A03290 [Brassica rapa]
MAPSLQPLILIITCFGVFTSHVLAKTDSQDVSALNDAYKSMNSPSKLNGWSSSGGDPCGDSWDGITCKGSSVTQIKVSGRGLSGSLGYQLANLKSLTYLDVSKNNLNGNLPYQLPENLKYAVKEIDASLLGKGNPEEFSHIVSNISSIHHPNMAELVGYCSEQGRNMLVYEYFTSGSLNRFLHQTDDFSRPLTWNTRIRIALGTAQAIEYLHEVCLPPLVHKNIKSSNILLDSELNPHLSDYGLANFHHRTSQNLGVGYNAPECADPSAYTLKSDVYSFGVVMLELLTGRMPYDSDRPKAEQSLVRWAKPKLKDMYTLEEMVDPALCGLYAPESLSAFADIVSICVMPEPGLRPPVSNVVEALKRLV